MDNAKYRPASDGQCTIMDEFRPSTYRQHLNTGLPEMNNAPLWTNSGPPLTDNAQIQACQRKTTHDYERIQALQLRTTPKYRLEFSRLKRTSLDSCMFNSYLFQPSVSRRHDKNPLQDDLNSYRKFEIYKLNIFLANSICSTTIDILK